MIGQNDNHSEKEINHMKNCHFNGHIIISDLTGHCLAVYKSMAGVRSVATLKSNMDKTECKSGEITSIQVFSTVVSAYKKG